MTKVLTRSVACGWGTESTLEGHYKVGSKEIKIPYILLILWDTLLIPSLTESNEKQRGKKTVDIILVFCWSEHDKKRKEHCFERENIKHKLQKAKVFVSDVSY